MTQKNGWRDAAVCLALALGVAALYYPTSGFDFVSAEDRVYVLSNPHVNKGLAGVFGWAFQAGYAALWQPLTWISHALDCQIYGLRPGGHHASNVLLHALNSARGLPGLAAADGRLLAQRGRGGVLRLAPLAC